MNEFVDMHVHSKFSIDGMSTMEDYCLIAGKTGTRVICFTEHVDTIMSAQSITKLYNAEAKRENITRFTKRVPGIEKTLLGTAYVGTRIFLRNSWCGR